MPDPRALGAWLRRFLEEYLVSERNLARNTQLSYRDTLALLLPFVGARTSRPVDRLTVRDLSPECVRAFLVHIEEGRGCSPRTRNQRLAAIRAFARYVAVHSPEQVEWCGQICAIPTKKVAPPAVGYLEKPELDALLDVPDPATQQGRCERGLLLFLYHSGARVSEAAELTVGALQLAGAGSGRALVTLRGKGGKVRRCPLLEGSQRALAGLVAGRADGEAVFLNRRGDPLTRSGMHQLVKRCAAKAVARAPSLAKKRVGPHVLRHYSAFPNIPSWTRVAGGRLCVFNLSRVNGCLIARNIRDILPGWRSSSASSARISSWARELVGAAKATREEQCTLLRKVAATPAGRYGPDDEVPAHRNSP